MATVTKSIGTNARDYSTITLWEADLDNAAVYASGDAAVGECYNDSAFSETFTVNGGGTVGLSSITLTAASGQRHDGTAGTGSRVVNPSSGGLGAWMTVNIPKTMSWLEIDANNKPPANGAAYLESSSVSNVASNLIVHGVNRAAFGASTLLRLTNSVLGGVGKEQIAINNVCYDYVHTAGNPVGLIQSTGGTNITWFYNNTVHDITNNSALGTTIGVSAAGTVVSSNNICTQMDGSSSGSKVCYGSSTSYNLSDDATASGTGSLTNKTAANQFVSTTVGSEDLHLKAGSDAIDAGTDLGTTPTGVNIDIDGRDRDAEGDTWDIGADEYVSASTPVVSIMLAHGLYVGSQT